MFWFDKKNPLVLYGDIRDEKHTLCDGRILEIRPDVKLDFTDMPFDDSTFYLVVFDPPHLRSAGRKGWQAKKYGALDANWPSLIKSGFDECMRVLKPNGTLIFKWNEQTIKVSKVLEVVGTKPLFGHRTTQASKTIWMTFYKQA